MGRITGVLIALALALLLPAAAGAAFPGENGMIAFVRGGDIWTMNPDGTDQVNLTDDGAVQGSPAWSPDGSKIAFEQSGPSNSSVIWTMLADGSNRVQANQVFNKMVDPAWSPDGLRIVFSNVVALFTMNPDGTSVFGPLGGGLSEDPEWSPSGSLIVYQWGRKAPCSYAKDLAVVAPDGNGDDFLTSYCNNGNLLGSTWSPDAQRIAYMAGCAEFCGPGLGFHTIKPDGTDRQPVPGGGLNPTYSPDGTRFAYESAGSLHTMNIDGTGVSGPITTGTEPDWQPILRGYARPKAATPMYVPLVPAYESCTTPNRVHAAPLSYNSCNPPNQTSGFATVGSPDANGAAAKSVGSLKLVAIGEVPINTGNGNQSDVLIDASITDVRNKTGLTDYTGGLRVKAALQITDRNNTPYPGGPGPGTVAPTTFEFNVPCATTPSDATIGSTCATSTTANAVLPGQVLERQRAIWELGRVEVHDGGTDGDPSTGGDNTLFATQGVFVP